MARLPCFHRHFTKVLAGVALGATITGDAQAGMAWGDASLKNDDVRIELDASGRAIVTHSIGVHVGGKRFRAFVIDGVDDKPEPPPEDAAGRDGPGWTGNATDAKGAPWEVLIEPTKEPRRLRVRLGLEGIPRGDYTIRIRYRVDLAKQGAFVREGAMVRFAWTAPKWPEGYDSGRITFAIPSAPTEPRVAQLDGSGETEKSADGVALVALRRTQAIDELELTRPHVPHDDDARWIVRLDPKALADIAAQLGPREPDRPDAMGSHRRARHVWAMLIAFASALGLGAALAVARRDAAAQSHAESRGLSFRSLLPLSPIARAVVCGLAIVGASFVTISAHPFVASACLLVAMASMVLRPARPTLPARASGRWLAFPKDAVPEHAVSAASSFDPSGGLGAFLALALFGVTLLACVLLARRHLPWSVAAAMHAIVFLPLFTTGRARQLPPSSPFATWPILSEVELAMRGLANVRVRLVARTADGKIDELRLRIDPKAAAIAKGLKTLEVGCAVVHGAGSAALVPELLLRLETDSEAARVLASRIAKRRDSATFGLTLGRAENETVLAIRPMLTSPASLRRWIEWSVRQVEGREVEAAKNAKTVGSRGSLLAPT